MNSGKFEAQMMVLGFTRNYQYSREQDGTYNRGDERIIISAPGALTRGFATSMPRNEIVTYQGIIDWITKYDLKRVQSNTDDNGVRGS